MEKKKKDSLLPLQYPESRMILIGLSVLGLGLAIAWIGFLFFAH